MFETITFPNKMYRLPAYYGVYNLSIFYFSNLEHPHSIVVACARVVIICIIKTWWLTLAHFLMDSNFRPGASVG